VLALLIFFSFRHTPRLALVSSALTWHEILPSFTPLSSHRRFLSLQRVAHRQRNSLSLLWLWSRLLRRLVRFTPPFDV
jgi:hypothetical protein